MNPWPYQTNLEIAATPNAAYWARRHAEKVLTGWGLWELLPQVQLVVTELVGKAVRETSTMDAASQAQYLRDPAAVPAAVIVGAGTVRLRFSADETRLLIEVWDSSPGPPTMNQQTAHGLTAVCTRLGWYFALDGGRVVWAEVGRG